MVSTFFKLLNRDVTTMNQAALVLAVFSLLSQVFGLLRDRLLASMVGPSAHLDVYYAAFRIPDFIYISVASLFSVTVIIPFITSYLAEKDGVKSRNMKVFSDTIFTVYCMGMIIVCSIAFIVMPYLTHFTAPGFSDAQLTDLVFYSRVMLLSPFLMGLSNLLGSFAQVQKKFFSFAIAPLFYNLGILAGIIFLLPLFGMLGVVLGVLVGAVLYLIVQLPTLIAISTLPRFTKVIDWKIVKEITLSSVPRTLALSLTNLTMLMMSAVASLLAAGSISIFQLSYNIETVPLMIIGISYAVAAFPTMTRLFMEGQTKEFVDVIHRAARNIFFLSIPAAILFIVLRAQLVRVLLGSGAFSWNDTRLVAASVAVFCLSVTAQCLVLLLVRGFYAMGNTKTPLLINIYSIIFTGISLAGLLLCFREFPLFRDFLESLLRIDGVEGTSVVLLPLAFSLGQIGNAVALWMYFHKKVRGHVSETKDLGRALFHTLGAGIIAGASAYATLMLLGSSIGQEHFLDIFLQGLLAGGVGISLYAITLMAMRNEDIISFIQTMRSKFWKQKPLTEELPEL